MTLQNCDTFHGLLAAYRNERGIPLTLEPTLLRAKVGGGNHIRKYDALPLLNKVEIFQEILDETAGTCISDWMIYLKYIYITYAVDWPKELIVKPIYD